MFGDSLAFLQTIIPQNMLAADNGRPLTLDQQDAADEAMRRMRSRSTYTEPLFSTAILEVYSVPLHQANQDDCCVGQDVSDAIMAEEAEIEGFLDTFNLNDKTEEISELLRPHGSLRTHFEALVPVVVSYTDFWTRFYYRCDKVRILRTWKDEDDRAAAAVVARARTAQYDEESDDANESDEDTDASYKQKSIPDATTSSPTSVTTAHYYQLKDPIATFRLSTKSL